MAVQGLPVVSAEIPTICPFTQFTALQSTFTHPAPRMSIEPSEQRKRCKSMVFSGSYGESRSRNSCSMVTSPDIPIRTASLPSHAPGDCTGWPSGPA